MRKEQNKGEVVRLKELQESVIPEENLAVIKEVNEEVFSCFGINIDQTAIDR